MAKSIRPIEEERGEGAFISARYCPGPEGEAAIAEGEEDEPYSGRPIPGWHRKGSP